MAAGGDERYLVCAAGAAGVVWFLLCVLQRVVVSATRVRSSMRFLKLLVADGIGMAAWMLPALYCGEEAGGRNLAFFRVKWLQAAMKGTSCVRRVQLGSFGSFYVFSNEWLFLCV